jgi:crotonobetainyl-CoA:carnitine CoA-transferase CaiB-like acyl-CoA transferase
VPGGAEHASDGHIIVACGNDGQFQKFCGVLGTTWHLDPDYSGSIPETR